MSEIGPLPYTHFKPPVQYPWLVLLSGFDFFVDKTQVTLLSYSWIYLKQQDDVDLTTGQ